MAVKSMQTLAMGYVAAMARKSAAMARYICDLAPDQYLALAQKISLVDQIARRTFGLDTGVFANEGRLVVNLQFLQNPTGAPVGERRADAVEV
jgi:hypothetical protein